MWDSDSAEKFGLSLEDFRVLCRWVRVGNGHEVEPVGSVLSCGGGKKRPGAFLTCRVDIHPLGSRDRAQFEKLATAAASVSQTSNTVSSLVICSTS
jgi:hypothetical protein